MVEGGETGIVAKLHIDVVSFTPTLYVDGVKYVEDGRLLFQGASSPTSCNLASEQLLLNKK